MATAPGGVGRDTATYQLDQLVTALRAGGHEILSVEQEYVVHDSHLDLDMHANAYRAGEPIFIDPATGRRWRDTRRAAMRHLLRVLAESPWAAQLVLRGSVTMAAWVGEAAREPGDLDFVVTPATTTSDSTQARALLDGIIAAVATANGAGLQPQRTAESAIWTYERADGRRLVIPFAAAGIPDGSVQIDIVFGEHLPIPPEPITLPGATTQCAA